MHQRTQSPTTTECIFPSSEKMQSGKDYTDKIIKYQLENSGWCIYSHARADQTIWIRASFQRSEIRDRTIWIQHLEKSSFLPIKFTRLSLSSFPPTIYPECACDVGSQKTQWKERPPTIEKERNPPGKEKKEKKFFCVCLWPMPHPQPIV